MVERHERVKEHANSKSNSMVSILLRVCDGPCYWQNNDGNTIRSDETKEIALCLSTLTIRASGLV
jgi:hypothetical protein